MMFQREACEFECVSSKNFNKHVVSNIRMRKKLDTRFPAARIKKIMQADEEVGKIAMATPVLISKALELFLQDLCNQTYDITLRRGAKTMNSHHLKECVRAHSVFDFLRDTVSRVPDLDAESAGGSDTSRRRKHVEGDNDDSGEDEAKRLRQDPQTASSSRGRGRGRGRGRRSNSEKLRSSDLEKLEDNETAASPQLCEDGSNVDEAETGADKATVAKMRRPKDFDLNMDLNENGEVATRGQEDVEGQFESYGTDLLLGHNQNIFQPEEDYDCEDEN